MRISSILPATYEALALQAFAVGIGPQATLKHWFFLVRFMNGRSNDQIGRGCVLRFTGPRISDDVASNLASVMDSWPLFVSKPELRFPRADSTAVTPTNRFLTWKPTYAKVGRTKPSTF